MSSLDAARYAMDAALKACVVPTLRNSGFKGAYPHFHRDLAGHVDLLTFQFRSSGGLFVVEISYADRKRRNVFFEADRAVAKLRVSQARDRFRLGVVEPKFDHWFDFRGSDANYQTIAATVAELVCTQGEDWWNARRMTFDGEVS